MRISNQPLITTTEVVTTTWESKAIWLGHIANYAIQLVFSASACTFKLQGSCDEGNPSGQSQGAVEANVVNWTDIDTTDIATTGAGDLMYNIQNAGYNWVRVVATGTATVTSARFNVKGV